MKKIVGFCVSYSRGEFEMDSLGIMDDEKREEINGYLEEMGDVIEYKGDGLEEFYGEEVGYVFVEVEVGKGYELRYDGDGERMSLIEKDVEVENEEGIEVEWEDGEEEDVCFGKIKLK